MRKHKEQQEVKENETPLEQTSLENKESFSQRFLKEAFDFVKIFVIVLGLWILCNTYFFELNLVMGRSMDPTLKDADRIIVNKIAMHFRALERGDIVTLDGEKIQSQYEGKFLVKRVIGIPGDRVEIKDGVVYVNGERLEETYLEDLPFTMTGQYNDVVLQENEYYVLGDNRSHSADSRYFGVVKKEAVKGYLIFRIFPFYSFGHVD